MHLAALLLLQSLNFNSSGLTPAQISWLNPFGLPTAATPTIPQCVEATDYGCEMMFDPTFEELGFEVLIFKWMWACRHAYCPWDLDLWENTYGGSEEETCGFWGTCQELPGWEPPPGYVTPEPASLILLGTGLMGLAAAARRRNRRVTQGRVRDHPAGPS